MIFNIIKNIFLYSIFYNVAFAQINIVTTTPDLAYMARIIGGSNVNVFSLLEGTEDPHFVDATPLFIQKAAEAKLFIQVGLGLEEGWTPRVLGRSGNRSIQQEGEGLCTVGSDVTVLEKPVGKVDRSMGDVHGEGNPHFHLGPEAFKQGAHKVYKCLLKIIPEKSDELTKGLEKINSEIVKAQKDTSQILKDIKNKVFAEYHKQFLYFFHEYGLKHAEPLEEIPGVPPSAGRLLSRAMLAKKENLYLLIATPYHSKKTLNKFRELSNVRFLILPSGIKEGTESESFSFYKLQTYLAKELARE